MYPCGYNVFGNYYVTMSNITLVHLLAKELTQVENSRTQDWWIRPYLNQYKNITP